MTAPRGLTLAIFLSVHARAAATEVQTYVIAIGNNAPPAGASDGLRPLRYADDDAAAVYSIAREIGAHAVLLTVLDADSQRRYPGLAEIAVSPTLAELRRTVAWHEERIQADRAAGRQAVVILFYSGHGSRGGPGPASLALLDGPFTQAVLYDELLSALPANFVHVLVDACHAESVVRPRDAEAETVDLSDDDVRAYATRTTLARFPNVGAIVATAAGAQAHEWDNYQHGVFTHELLSGLRGAADVNHDRRIEYSELHAFLAAANREVLDPRARLGVVVRAPSMNRRAAIVDLSARRDWPTLRGAAAALGWFYLEDERGNRLAELRAERGFEVALLVPAGRLFLRTADAEAELDMVPRGQLELAQVTLRPATTAPRGALESALRRGLFASAFGPVYYRGFVDRSEDAMAVEEPAASVHPSPRDRPLRATSSRRRAATWALYGGGVAMGAAAVVFGGLALKARSDFGATEIERPAADARSRFEYQQGTAIGALVLGGALTIAGIMLQLTQPDPNN